MNPPKLSDISSGPPPTDAELRATIAAAERSLALHKKLAACEPGSPEAAAAFAELLAEMKKCEAVAAFAELVDETKK